MDYIGVFGQSDMDFCHRDIRIPGGDVFKVVVRFLERDLDGSGQFGFESEDIPEGIMFRVDFHIIPINFDSPVLFALIFGVVEDVVGVGERLPKNSQGLGVL